MRRSASDDDFEVSPPSVGGSSSASGGTGALPPEVELEDNFKAPVATGKYLFTANPASNNVALINGESLEIETLEAGHEPTFVAGLPDTDQRGGALVINVRSHDASVYLLPKDGTPEDLFTAKVPVHEGANAWTVGPSGTFAVAWTQTGSSQSDGAQDITIVEPLEDPVATRIGVGFRPSRVFISTDETRAVIVSDPGISVIELGSMGTSGVIAEHPLPEAGASGREVVVTPDAKYALVRSGDAASLLALDLDDGTRTTLALPGPLSDLDVSPDGKLAVGVIRGAEVATPGTGGMGGLGNGGEGGLALGGEGGALARPSPEDSHVILLQIPADLSGKSELRSIPVSDIVGSASLTRDGKGALLFSNATANSHVWLLETGSGALRLVDVRSPVQAVLPTPDGQHAVAILAPPEGSARRGAFALIPVGKDLPPRIEGTPAPTAQVAFSPEGDAVLITTRATSGGQSRAYVGGFPHLSVDEVPLPSPPLAAGVIGLLHKGFIAEEHPEGRITFVGLNDKTVTTLTGYELGSRVVE